jgi:putative FmdB family regulatory protein
MPIYEYRCGACGRDFERYVQHRGAAVECPSCASVDVRRKLSVVSVRSEGSLTPSPAAPGGGCCSGGCSCR